MRFPSLSRSTRPFTSPTWVVKLAYVGCHRFINIIIPWKPRTNKSHIKPLESGYTVYSSAEAPFSLVGLGSHPLGYALGLYSPVSKIMMTIFHDDGYSWSIHNTEPHNTLVNTVTYIGAFTGIMTASFFVREQ